MRDNAYRLLTPNCHEAWVYQLGYLDYDLDIIDGLPGRYCTKWDTNVRPFPDNATRVSLDQVLKSRPFYDCIITHNITDLMDLKTIPGPRILVIHSTLDGRVRQHGLGMPPKRLKTVLHNYLEVVGGHTVAVSALKGKSWGLVEDIVEFGVDLDAYPPWSGETAAGLRVSNQISNRKEILLWNFHEAAFKDIDVKLVGFNPDMSDVIPSRSWDDLKSILRSHRFFIHTAHPDLEDGCNMATVEAMAAGLPILGNRHSASPIEHGVSGFLSDDPEELKGSAQLLIRDKDLAGRMGAAARQVAHERFSIKKFVNRFKRSIETARAKWGTRRITDSYFSPEAAGENEQVCLVVRSGRFLHLGEIFQDHVVSEEIEKAVAVLDEVMKLLDLPRDISISSLDELIKLIAGVSERLIALHDYNSAGLFAKTALILSERNRDRNKRNNPSDKCQQAVLEHP
jgi:hypothetical protein